MIYGCGRSASHHVGCAGSHRSGANKRPHPKACFRESGCRVDHGLFVAKQVITQRGILLQRLSDPGYVSMSKNAQTSSKEPNFLAVALGKLVSKESDSGLGRSHARSHRTPPFSVLA